MKRNYNTNVSLVSKTDLQEKAVIWELFVFVANVCFYMPRFQFVIKID